MKKADEAAEIDKMQIRVAEEGEKEEKFYEQFMCCSRDNDGNLPGSIEPELR